MRRSDDTDFRAIGLEGARLFGQGHYCGEAVLEVVSREAGQPVSPRLATGFCSGLSRTGGPCGALMGAVLAVNLLTGRDDPAADREKDILHANYALVDELVERFQERFGATACTELTGCDLSTPEGSLRYREENKYDRCRELIAGAIEDALIVLAERPDAE